MWKEWERALGESHPEKFFSALEQCSAFTVLFPTPLHQLDTAALLAATQLTTDTSVRFAVLWYALPDAKQHIAAVSKRYRIPTAYKELAILIALNYADALQCEQLTAEQLLCLQQRLDVFRRERRFKLFIQGCTAIAQSKQIKVNLNVLMQSVQVAQSIDIPALLAQGLTGDALVTQIRQQRLQQLAAWLTNRL